MSIGVLLGQKHMFNDDLESIFYILVWICVHYEGPSKPRKSSKKVRKEQDSEDEASASEPEEDEDDSTSDEEGSVSVHESLTGGGSEAQEIEKSNLTVFLGNVSSKAITSHSAKNTLIKRAS